MWKYIGVHLWKRTHGQFLSECLWTRANSSPSDICNPAVATEANLKPYTVALTADIDSFRLHPMPVCTLRAIKVTVDCTHYCPMLF